ncbi:hypothetical protein QJQ45_004187 [Haematococcus lacustris]|nr:hypothetical protein QJQ45_004187 [Haematococcus lacustris]
MKLHHQVHKRSVPLCGPGRSSTSIACRPAHSSPSESCASQSHPNPAASPDLPRLVAVAGVTIIVSTLVGGVHSARAHEIAWRPRRHYRRLDERFSSNWAAELVEEEDRAGDAKAKEQRQAAQLRRQAEEAEATRRRSEEAARRRKAEEMLAKELAAARRTSSLPFSIQIAGHEMAPAIVYGGAALLALSALKAAVSAAGAARSKPGRGKGKWVYDRSLGGKKVWVADDSVTSAVESSRPLISDRDINQLASIAAAAAPSATNGVSAGTATSSVGTSTPLAGAAFEVPSWWNPGPRFVPDQSTRAARKADADRLLSRIETNKNRGQDYALSDILKLRQLCQEGCVSVSPRTVGSRDAIYRAAVEAAVSYSSDPIESGIDLGDLPPTRFLSALANDLGLSEDKAVAAVCGLVAATTRARLLEALASIKAGAAGVPGAETEAVLAIIRLTSLLQKLPVLSMTGNEVPLIADSLQTSFDVEERRKAFYLFGQLFPEAAALGAALLGFQPNLVVPQLMKDMEAYQR